MSKVGDHGSSRELILMASRHLSDKARERSFRMCAGDVHEERGYLIAGRDGEREVSSEEDESRRKRSSTE